MLYLLAALISLASASGPRMLALTSAYAGHLPEPGILQTAWQLWPCGPEFKGSPEYHALKALVDARDWTGAIRFAESLTAHIPAGGQQSILKAVPWQWTVGLAELYTYSGRPRNAVLMLRRVLSALRGNEDISDRYARNVVEAELARAMAEIGDYRSAAWWLKRSLADEWSNCGNYVEARETYCHAILFVWQKASGPYSTAMPALEAIIGGQFSPRDPNLADESPEVQLSHARDEAALALAELYVRNRRPGDAVKYFQMAARSDHAIAYIAQTRLKLLEKAQTVRGMGKPSKRADAHRCGLEPGGPLR